MTKETKQPWEIEAGAHLNTTAWDSHEKFSSTLQGHV